MEWFIVAIVYMSTDDINIQQMAQPFETRELCQKYYQNNRAVANDIVLMYPNQQGHSLVCLNTEQVEILKGTPV